MYNIQQKSSQTTIFHSIFKVCRIEKDNFSQHKDTKEHLQHSRNHSLNHLSFSRANQPNNAQVLLGKTKNLNSRNPSLIDPKQQHLTTLRRSSCGQNFPYITRGSKFRLQQEALFLLLLRPPYSINPRYES